MEKVPGNQEMSRKDIEQRIEQVREERSDLLQAINGISAISSDGNRSSDDNAVEAGSDFIKLSQLNERIKGLDIEEAELETKLKDIN